MGGRRIEAPALVVQPHELAADRKLFLQPVRRHTAALGADVATPKLPTLVRTPFTAILGVLIRTSVQTRMAVGQVAIFRSVR
jgi:hypothetical protein